MKIFSLASLGMTQSMLAFASLVLFQIASALAQAPPPQAPPPQAPAPPEQSSLALSPEQLDELLAPVALYPDALVALILPASTFPSDLVLASRYVGSNGDPAQLGNQPWDESVKSLVRYPDVLKWMDQNLEWTTAVGDAFVAQPADVMTSIQRLRAAAATAGNLVDTPQQRIIREKTCIRIVPAEPDFIYVPQYDPEVVYERAYEPDYGPPLAFGVGFAVGSWLNYDCDWDRRSIYVGKWRPGWKDRWDDRDRGREWDRGDRRPDNSIVNVVNISGDSARPWRPSENSQRRQRERQRDPGNARFSAANVSEGNRQAGRRSVEALGISADQRAKVPRPSRLTVANEGNERGGRNSRAARGANETQQLLPAPNPEAVTPRGGGRKGKVPSPSAAPNIQAKDGMPPAPAENQGKGSRGKGGKDNRSSQPGRAPEVPPNAPNSAGATSPAEGKNKNDRAPSPAVSGPAEAGAAQRGSENLKKGSRGGGSPGQGERHKEQAPAPSGVANAANPDGNGSSHRKAGKTPQSDNAPKNQRNRPSPGSSGSGQKQEKHHPQNATAQSTSPGQQGGGKQKHGEASSGGSAKHGNPAAAPAAQRHEQPRPAAAPQQNAPSQHANAPHGKGKGGGGKKGEEKKDKGGN